MKILASVIGLVLVGLTGGWLWMDATAEAREDTAGVVITGAVDPVTASGLADAGQPVPDIEATTSASSGRPATLDQVVTLLSSTSDALVTRADEARQAEKAAAEKTAEEKAAAEQRTREEQPVPVPVPVQPAPVTPSGCEWDDDHAEWDCEDDGGDDDWDDEDWDDDDR